MISTKVVHGRDIRLKLQYVSGTINEDFLGNKYSMGIVTRRVWLRLIP